VVKFLARSRSASSKWRWKSTYNCIGWWTGCELDYPVVLANPAAMQQYSGIKSAGDTHDAFFLAEQSG